MKLGMTHGRADLQVYGVNIREKIEEERVLDMLWVS